MLIDVIKIYVLQLPTI